MDVFSSELIPSSYCMIKIIGSGLYKWGGGMGAGAGVWFIDSQIGRYFYFSHSMPFITAHGFNALKFTRNGISK